MTTTTQKRANPFFTQAKSALAPNQELTQDGLICRKRKGGTGTWRYDFVDSGHHALRHALATRAAEAGINLPTL